MCFNSIIKKFVPIIQVLPEDGQHKILIKSDYNTHPADGLEFSVHEMYINICNYCNYVRILPHALIIKLFHTNLTFPSHYLVAKYDQDKKISPGGEFGKMKQQQEDSQTSFPSCSAQLSPSFSAGLWLSHTHTHTHYHQEAANLVSKVQSKSRQRFDVTLRNTKVFTSLASFVGWHSETFSLGRLWDVILWTSFVQELKKTTP